MTTIGEPAHQGRLDISSRFPIVTCGRFPSCHSSTICELPGGGMLVACYAGKREGSADSVILGTRFDYDKREWSEPEVWVNVAHRAVANPRVFIGPCEGEVWLLCGINYGRWCSGSSRLFIKRSYDEGRSWTDLELLIDTKGILGKNKPLRYKSVWIIPIEREESWSATFIRSEDDGRTWELIGNLGEEVGAHLIQPTVVMLRDGSLMAYMRSQEEYIFKSYSHDMGRTWSTSEPTSLPNNNSSIDMVRLRSGNLALVCNPIGTDVSVGKIEATWPSVLPVGFKTWGPRTPLKIALSLNEGESWPYWLTLEDGRGEYSYPAIVQSQDGVIHVTYSYRRKAIRHVELREEQIVGT